MRKLLFMAAALLASLQVSTATAESAGTCTDPSGETIAADCNAYLETLYQSCPNPEEIMDSPDGDCVSINQFRRPLMGCSDVDCEVAHPYEGHEPFAYGAPSDVYKVEGNLGAEMIVIFLSGGPSGSLNDAYAQFLEGHLLVAYVAQTNFTNPGLLSTYDITVEEAELEIAEDIDLIHTAYLDLRERFPDRKIALMGHSMGSFLVLRYLAEHGNNFDKVVAMAGRVDAPLDFVRRFAIGQNLVFDHIGDREVYMKQMETHSLTELGPYLVQGYNDTAETAILSAVAVSRYSDLLASTDLSNMLYLYSARDEQLDGLDAGEVAFLEGRGATVTETGWDEELRGHSRMILRPEFHQIIGEFLQQP